MFRINAMELVGLEEGSLVELVVAQGVLRSLNMMAALEALVEELVADIDHMLVVASLLPLPPPLLHLGTVHSLVEGQMGEDMGCN